MKARIVVDNLRPAYIHTITLEGIRAKEQGHPLLHPTAYYTLNNIPEGKTLSLNEVSTRNSAVTMAHSPLKTSKESMTANKTSIAKSPEAKQVPSKVPDFFDVKGLLVNYTCTACHTTANKQVGPGFVEIAKRNYTNEKIVELIHNPQPQNWPDYETAMPPMPQVTYADAIKIAAWINSLDD
jgi:cytochrome c551/c552